MSQGVQLNTEGQGSTPLVSTEAAEGDGSEKRWAPEGREGTIEPLLCGRRGRGTRCRQRQASLSGSGQMREFSVFTEVSSAGARREAVGILSFEMREAIRSKKKKVNIFNNSTSCPCDLGVPSEFTGFTSNQGGKRYTLLQP